MKKLIYFIFALAILVSFSSCSRVDPNHVGVQMVNYGKNGKSDYTLQKGLVWTVLPGTKLFEIPTWEQKGEFTEENSEGDEIQKIIHLKSSDNTEFSTRITYSYCIVEESAVDVVFNNSHLGSGSDFLEKLEDNVLEVRIYDILKETSREFSTDYLMSQGGSLRYEDTVEILVTNKFKEIGIKLISFSCPLEFSKKVTEKIDQRNEVNTNIGVLDQKIAEQKKTNELEELKTQQMIIKSRGITPELLQQQFIEKWDGSAPIYGSAPFFIKPINK